LKTLSWNTANFVKHPQLLLPSPKIEKDIGRPSLSWDETCAAKQSPRMPRGSAPPRGMRTVPTQGSIGLGGTQNQDRRRSGVVVVEREGDMTCGNAATRYSS